MSSGAEEPARGEGQRPVDSAPRLCVIVTGATGLVGHYLLPLLMERGFAVQAISRRPRPRPAAGPGMGAPQAGVDV